MITTKFLKDIYTEARPIIERHLDDAELLAGMREVVAAQGGDWSSLKALITAQIKDERDEVGDGKRVKKILDKADYSAAYADMLGLANMNDGNNSADDGPTAEDVRGLFVQEAPHDPETGEIIETESNATPAGAVMAATSGATGGESAAQVSTPVAQWLEPSAHNGLAAGSNPAGRTNGDMEIPDFLRRTKPPPELVE